jgi:hypothetical protein
MPTILSDKLISLRLSAYPEFHLRLEEFLCAYHVGERPALIVQARPAHGSTFSHVDVDDTNLQSRFVAGVPTNNTPWWDGFRSMVAIRRTFHGIGSLPTREQPHWASEVHRDGHFIAGVWKYPQLPAQNINVDVLGDFYADMFGDLFRLVESTLEGMGQQPPYHATWTLTQAPKLHYASPSMFGRFTITAPPLEIPHLQSLVSTASVGMPEWMELSAQMGQALTGAYGGVPPRHE